MANIGLCSISLYTRKSSLESAVTEEDCRAALERIRWPEGPVCPECGATGSTIVRAFRGEAHRPGLYLCASCRTQFTVTVGTPLKGSKLPLAAWIKAAHLLNAHKPVTVREVQMALGVTYKTAWQMVRKLLEGMEGYRGRLSLPGKDGPSVPPSRRTLQRGCRRTGTAERLGHASNNASAKELTWHQQNRPATVRYRPSCALRPLKRIQREQSASFGGS
ncbi:hypothetical protein DY468_12445 [Rhodopseudomonas sp. BR0M22]|nr:hypothetical protein [Rhodopseudomonas sp. BR0M22]